MRDDLKDLDFTDEDLDEDEWDEDELENFEFDWSDELQELLKVPSRLK